MELTTCFSGHRPEKLNMTMQNTLKIQSILQKEIIESINAGCNKFLSGMARGIDLLAAEYIIELKKSHPLQLFAIRPFATHGEDFKGEWACCYNYVLSKCDSVIVVSPQYAKDSYKRRNFYMVDHSTHLIAVVKNYNSGTGQTIAYANKLQKNVKILDCNFL
ncbi:MAG: DUF1273 domain-containing protein [Oscillospiraceae bacterium]|jgi:uncharacterized phage-like protein YoqJ|nr:DUF1273 domain-containing protein [Oscillospiraceae bacterium]